MRQRSIHTPARTPSRQPAVRRRRRVRLPLSVTASGFGWRWVSAGLAAAILILGIVVLTNKVFRVARAEVGGVRYVPAEEIFAQSDVAGMHVLQIDPDVVAERVARSPSLDSAQVLVRWPARVIIIVREREPAIVWEQGGAQYWVDGRGNLMLMRQYIPSLVRVVNEGDAIPFRCPGPTCPDQGTVTIDPDVVLGTQHLKSLRDNIEMLYYDPVRGLSYQDGRGWRGYFGVGTDMDFKLAIYETLVADLETRGLHPVYIDVSNPDAPFYRLGP
jgi:hypothetical protein